MVVVVAATATAGMKSAANVRSVQNARNATPKKPPVMNQVPRMVSARNGVRVANARNAASASRLKLRKTSCLRRQTLLTKPVPPLFYRSMARRLNPATVKNKAVVVVVVAADEAAVNGAAKLKP